MASNGSENGESFSVFLFLFLIGPFRGFWEIEVKMLREKKHEKSKNKNEIVMYFLVLTCVIGYVHA